MTAEARHDLASSRPRVSVCMATYNGAAFVADQIASILPQLWEGDELLIVDDASTDDTVAVLAGIEDARIQVHVHQQNRGYVRTFEEALRLASGDLLLLSDQDDVWTPDHVAVLVNALADADVAATNLATLDGPEAIRGPYGQEDWHLTRSQSSQRTANVLGVLAGNRPYYGCAMGIRVSALRSGLAPFPGFLHESHDLWIALYGNTLGTIRHCEERTVLRRFHDANETPNRPRGPLTAIGSRILLLRLLRVLRNRGRHLPR